MQWRTADCRGEEWSIVTVVVPSVAPTPAMASASPGASAAPTMQVDEPWIAYQWEDHTGVDGIYLVRPDGTDPHALLPDAKYGAYHPDWSPDGSQIAFDAETGGGDEIWVVNADGTDAAVIVPRSTDCAISCGEVALPAWSPDGSKIAFVRFKLGASGLEAAVIEVQDVASGHRRVLFTAPSKTALNYPRWSSGGRSIVFEDDAVPGLADQQRCRHGIRDRRHRRHRGGRQTRRPDRLVDVRDLPQFASGIR